MSDEPETPRLTAWYEREATTGYSSRDHARTSVWWPREPPTARLQSHAHGPGQPDTLPAGPICAYLTLSGVDFGGALDDLEWFIDAAREALALVRYQADCMREAEASAPEIEAKS